MVEIPPTEIDLFDESAEYSPKSEFSKAKVVMETVQKCIEARSKEMSKGYYNTTITKDGLPIKTWIQDTRKVYVSAVTALRKLLTPEILEDKIYNGKEKEEHPLSKIDATVAQSKKDHSYYLFEEFTENGKTKFKRTKVFYLPEIDSIVKVRKIFPDGNEKLVELPGYWNTHVNAYWNHMVELNDLLFEELMRVIHRLKYYKGSIR